MDQLEQLEYDNENNRFTFADGRVCTRQELMKLVSLQWQIPSHGQVLKESPITFNKHSVQQNYSRRERYRRAKAHAKALLK